MKVLMKLLCLCLLTGCTTNTIFVNQQNNQKKQWDYAIADSQYFNDAVFIGSSRMLGLRQDQRFQSAMFYTCLLYTSLKCYAIVKHLFHAIEGYKKYHG